MLKLRDWFFNWLGIDAIKAEIARIHTELPLINERLNKINGEMAAAIQNLQLQITALTSADGPIAHAKPPEPEPVQMTRGMVRFSDRKRAYEASKRKPVETKAGKQIEENARLIASGTRKVDATS